MAKAKRKFTKEEILAKKEAARIEKLEAVKMEATKPVSELPATSGKEYTFKSRDGGNELKLSEPIEKNKASEVLFGVLAELGGKPPEGMKLQFASSYYGHFINRRGKNACGASKINNLLVVNGIAEELEKEGVTGIIQPQPSKAYRGIKLDGYGKSDLAELIGKIARVLGATTKTATAKKKAVSTLEEPVMVEVSDPEIASEIAAEAAVS